MWTFLASLNPVLSYSLLVLALVTVLIISLKGKLFVQWGKNKVGLGKGDGEKKESSEESIGNPPDTYIIPSCSDCVLVVLSMREKAQLAIDDAGGHILKNQMNFCEQKLAELTSIMLNEFIDMTNNATLIDASLRYEIFRALLAEIMDRLKSEIRRSFKENGFSEFIDSEFNNYLNNRYEYLETLATQHFSNRYLAYNTVLPSDVVSRIFNENEDKISSIVREMYTIAKNIKEKAEENIEIEKQTFATEIKEFVKTRNLV